MQEASRDDLVSRALAGDGTAFGRLLDPLLETAYRLAVTLLGDREAAEDAVQDACLVAWRKLGNLRPGSDLKPWFLAVVANRCRSTKRTGWWRVLRFAEMPEIVERATRDPETRADLASAFGSLGHDQRRVVALFYGLDLTIAQLAETLGCSESAAKARLYRAVAAMRPRLATREAHP